MQPKKPYLAISILLQKVILLKDTANNLRNIKLPPKVQSKLYFIHQVIDLAKPHGEFYTPATSVKEHNNFFLACHTLNTCDFDSNLRPNSWLLYPKHL